MSEQNETQTIIELRRQIGDLQDQLDDVHEMINTAQNISATPTNIVLYVGLILLIIFGSGYSIGIFVGEL